MPYRLKISEDEVRGELAGLGYTNVPDDMIVSFRKDLMKMIKNDLRKLKEERRKHEERPYSTGKIDMMAGTSTPLPPGLKHQTLQRPPKTASSKEEAGFESGYSDRESLPSDYTRYSLERRTETSDFGSLSDSSDKTERSLEALSRVSKTPSCKVKEREKPVKDKKSTTSLTNLETHRDLKSRTSAPVLRSSVRVKEKDHQAGLKEKKSAKATKSLPSYPSRNDPVSLYHYYRAHWDKHKVPGEDPRSKLRWQVRTKLFYST